MQQRPTELLLAPAAEEVEEAVAKAAPELLAETVVPEMETVLTEQMHQPVAA